MSALPIALATIAVLAFGGYFAGQELGATTMGVPYFWGDGEDLMETRTHAEGSVAGLLEQCQPVSEGVIPGHVVVTRDGTHVYGGARLAGLALEQTFDDVDHGLTVYRFCR